MHKIEVHQFLSTKKKYLSPKGEYEGDMLCQECENIRLGQLDDYGKLVLFPNSKSSADLEEIVLSNPIDGAKMSVISGYDYGKFKLFLLSILWRSSISSREMFKEGKIPTEDEENIRKMILNNNSGNIDEYPITLMSYLNDTSVARDLIMQPIRSKTEERLIISFLIAGFCFMFYVSSKYSKMEEIEKYSLTHKRFCILHIPLGKGWDFIKNFCGITNE